ncbi:hypothetical protein GOBAR_AA33311 [Gossypium barbadense]|uniref:Uncharacterized protein n=1 Tax=Gossypium barbadense TaxID=3634 RepID=A0A2P5W8J5_GOSBA|nr:hypothetical protein GOBAR_AA33311 [Gossypium barbadense]
MLGEDFGFPIRWASPSKGIGQGSKDTSNGTDSLSRKLDKVMDIDSFVRNTRNKRKTTIGAVRIGSASVLETVRPSSAQLPPALSLCSSLRFLLFEANTIGLRYGENEIYLKQNEDLMECLAIVETKVERLEREVAAERESKEALRAELDRLTKEHAAEIDRIIRECQVQVGGTIMEYLQVFEDFKKKTTENVLISILKLKMNILFHTQVAAAPFEVHKVDLDALEGVDMSLLGFDVLCPSGAIWDSFVSTWRRSLDFYIEKDPSANEDMVPSAMNNDVSLSDHLGMLIC